MPVRRITALFACTAMLIVAAGCAAGGRSTELSDADLLQRILDLEQTARGASREETRRLVRRFGEDLVGRRVRVSSAVIAAVYRREPEWNTDPYFAVDYERDTYVYTRELDPELFSELHRCRTWISATCTSASRQLMFELAVTPEMQAGLVPGREISFTCELAAVIRGGRSVYARAVRLDRDAGDGRPAGS